MAWTDDPVTPAFAVSDDLGWVQFNLELAPAPSFRVSSWPLIDSLDRWSRGADAERASWWLVRKPPGLRVRARGPGVDGGALAAWFAPHVKSGALARVWSTTYEPETDRLGGPAVIDAVHRWLVADTRAWVAHERTWRDGRARVGGELVCGLLLHELASQVSEDASETWAVWQSLCRSYAGAPAIAAGVARTDPLTLARRCIGPDEQAILGAAEAEARRLTSVLGAAWRKGTLVGGRRALIATLASFHFNLWCVGVDRAAALCLAMATDLHPAAVAGWAQLDQVCGAESVRDEQRLMEGEC